MGCFRAILDTVRILLWMLCDPFSRCFRWCCPPPKKSIKGEVVLLTGAGHGLGKEVARRLAKLGPVLVLWDINQENNEQVASELRSQGHRVFSYRVDVTDERAVAAAADRVKREAGDVTLVVNNAGVFSGHPLADLPPHIVKRCFDVNAMAHFWVLKQFLPRMIELNKGHVVAVASMAGHQGMANMSDYCASKHAAVGMMESLSMELQAMKKNNIKLTTINPIIITTGLISNVKSRFPSLLPLLSVEKTADIVVRSILKEEEEVFIPSRSKYLNDMSRCFSRRTRFKILDYVNYGFDLEVPKQPKKNGAEIV